MNSNADAAPHDSSGREVNREDLSGLARVKFDDEFELVTPLYVPPQAAHYTLSEKVVLPLRSIHSNHVLTVRHSPNRHHDDRTLWRECGSHRFFEWDYSDGARNKVFIDMSVASGVARSKT